MDTLTTPTMTTAHQENTKKTAVIIGAGPAGLTLALELLRHTDIHPIVLEADGDVGGIARTVWHHGNGIDIGGHRFFSKSDEVMQWWQEILPVSDDGEDAPEESMLVRERLSRILHGGKFFSYPVTLSAETIRGLGLRRLTRIGFSYLAAQLRPRFERSLEDFYINRFGRVLYETFFREYTEKVWGMPCNQIAPDWGAQRVKGLSVWKTLTHALGQLLPKRASDVAQKGTETSLIERFLYPRRGPGQMWQAVARRVEEAGGEIRMSTRVEHVTAEDDRVTGVVFRGPDGDEYWLAADHIASTMPVRELLSGLTGVTVPDEVATVAAELQYRDFLIVGLLVRGMTMAASGQTRIPDNWIYLQEPGIQAGRLQILNNWSPYMVADPDLTWLGVEYFVSENDELWNMSDDELALLAARELGGIGVIDPADVTDHTVVRVPKAYPAYTGSYAQLDVVRRYTERFDNLVLLGRNGQHRYNNQDHSMLTAIAAMRYFRDGATDATAIWEVNTEPEYHEEKSAASAATVADQRLRPAR